jgi:UDP-3-O-acyl N-acetylglucosamine deacetylase
MVMDDWRPLINSSRNQRTIGKTAAIEGFGYWSGRDVCLEFRPAEIDTGVVFVRRDLRGCPRIAARIAHRVEAPRRTTLAVCGATVDMVEHVMAALGGLGIDNCEVWTDQPEMPGCDGSSQPFVHVLDAAGIEEQEARRPVCVVRQVLRLGNEQSWVEVRPPSGLGSSLQYRLDYGPSGPIGRQTFEIALSPEGFRRELAPSRTFMLKSEAEALLAQGLGLRTTYGDLLVFDEKGPIDNPLRFPDECVRHKVLDMVGDLALAGRDLIGQFTAYRSGHRLNAELVRTLVGETGSTAGWRRCA